LISVRRDGSDGDAQELTEEVVDLGRTDGHLNFPDDPYLSERHCRFAVQDGAWVVQDLSSRNGVFLRIADSCELQDGDTILLGKQVLRFDLLSDAERNLAPAVEHGVMILGSPLREPWGRLRQLTVAGISRDVYYLYRPKVAIGREDGDLIFPDDEFMSRQHMSLSITEGKVHIKDVGSSNGTFVRIRDRPRLRNREMLRIGDQLLRFELA
jgi:pSer/pThr/pTyr-binding forkhead associated (FHA) protein